MSRTETTRLRVKVIAGASTTEPAGWLGEVLRVRISVPAEKGRANRALVATLGRSLALPARAIRIVSGQKSARKVLEIQGLSLLEIKRRLSTGTEPES